MRRLTSKGYQQMMGYLFVAPPMILFLLFTVYPVLAALFYSFTNFDILTTPKWVGLKNYHQLLGNALFFVTIKNIGFYVVMYVPSVLLLSLLTALGLNRQRPAMKVFRTIYYIPTLTSSIAASTIWLWIFNPDYGLANQLLAFVGIPGLAWVASSTTALPSIVIVTTWQGIGANMLIYLAGLKGIPNELYESAQLDGASRLQMFTRVTWPMLRPTTFFVLTMSLISAFQLFDQAFAMTQGGPGNATTTPVYLIYSTGFRQLQMGYASTMALVLFVIILIVSLLNVRLNGGEAAE